MTILTQTQTNVKNLKFFELTREGDQYFLITPQPAEYRLNRYRVRRHGSKKYDYYMEPVAGTSTERHAISEADAQALVAEAKQQNRISSYIRRDDDGEKRWVVGITGRAI